MRRSCAVLVALLAGLAFAGLALAGPAGAHSADGVMGIEVTPGTAPLTAKVRVLLEYASDRHVVPGATVTATAAGPDGATVGPVPLDDRGEGSYEKILALPTAGAWTVTVTAVDPAATAAAAVTVSAAVGPGTTAPTPADAGIETSSDRATQDRPKSADGGASPAFLAAIAVVVVAAAGVVVVLVRGRRG